MNLLLLFLVVITVCVCIAENVEVTGDFSAEPAVTHQRSLEDIMRFPVKTLRKMLTRKGLDCIGCTEKMEFAQKVYESQDVPDVASKVGNNDIPPEVDQEKLDELMANLRRGGFGNSKMFSAEDLKHMSPDEISAKLGGKKSRKGKKSKKSKASSSGSSSSSKYNQRPSEAVVAEEDDVHTIEL